MSGTNLRNQVLASFKKLHQTRKNVFKGDTFALDVARNHINHEYSVNKNLTNEDAITNLVKHAEDVEEVMRKTIIQAVKTKEGRYRAVLRKEVLLVDTPYKEMPDETPPLEGKDGACKENK